MDADGVKKYAPWLEETGYPRPKRSHHHYDPLPRFKASRGRGYRSSKRGVAWIKVGNVIHACHPVWIIPEDLMRRGRTGWKAFHKSLRLRGQWGRDERPVKVRNLLFNIDRLLLLDDEDREALEHCKCFGKHE